MAGVMVLSAAYGIWIGFAGNRGAWDSPVALALLTLLVGGYCLIHAAKRQTASNAAQLAAFMLLMPAAWVMSRGMITDSFWTRNAVLTIIATAIVMRSVGLRGAIAFLPFLLMAFWIMPFQEAITLAISYPLRLSSTTVSVAALYLMGMDISCYLTSIYVGGTSIAITDACSGVDQLGVLLLLGFILVHRLKAGTGWKIVYFMLLLPIVVAANAIRLILTIVIYKVAGNVAFNSLVHISLGYVFVILSVVMLYYAGKLFSEAGK
ncbi:MAG: exosortase/archaeosortase family protein [Victivallaceae bacterium]